jgi:beta-glucosidase-like glycosyl hydrolase
MSENALAVDIVVTADIPLAARCVAKGSTVLHPAGRPFTAIAITVNPSPSQRASPAASGPVSIPMSASQGARPASTVWPSTVARTPRPGVLAKASGSGQETPASRAASTTAREALELGINWVMAPDADLDVEPAYPIVQTRSFGADPAAVSAAVAALA